MNSIVTLLSLACLAAASWSGNDVEGNPIGRIVGLLRGLATKLETDLKAETDLFETYACWYKSTKITKTASNEAAGTRIDSLKTYIADIDAGRITFTTEEVDLQKQVADLKHDLESAKAMREAEEKDFKAAEAEMKQAVAALDSAITTMEDGTKGSLVQQRTYLGMLNTRRSLQKTIAFTHGLLDASEQKYLQQLLSDDEPKDWKKLNRKATFKNKYKNSSGKIMKTLAGLKTTFATNLKEAQDAEKAAAASYKTTSESKGKMLKTAETALTDMSAEKGARGVSKTDAQNEVDALETQVKDDTKFITDTQAAFDTKTKEWDARKETRGKEILAMSQAIAVLASDDARDTMKSSFKSSGYNFLQEEQSKPQQRCAARLVKSLASKSSDPALALLALATGNEAIKKVVKKIDEIVAMKKTEEADDLEKKEKCEKDLAEAASKSRLASLAMDTATEDIERAKSKIAELNTQIKEQEDKKTGLGGQIKQLKSQRGDENTLYKADKVVDQNAVDLVQKAMDFIKNWQTAKKFIQLSSSAVPKLAAPTAPEGIMPAPAKVAVVPQAPHKLAAAAIKVHTQQAPQFQSDAGAAPPPPPATFAGEYKGASEQGGIIGIMELVMTDMKKDITEAVADEKQAVTDFDKAKTDLEDEVKACDTAISAYKKDRSGQDKTLATKTGERGTKKDELESQMKVYSAAKPGCDFLLVNFEIRTKARQTETDGLKKAKAILNGGKFGKALMQETC